MIATELLLLSACIFLLFGIDDLIVDLLWLAGRFHDVPLDRLPAPPAMRFAIFVPVWRENGVIGRMLSTLLIRWRTPDIRVYCAAYPNDLATLAELRAVAARDARVRIVVNRRAGPTTKGDGLNQAWRALDADTASGAFVADAVLLHDAEDVVDAHELAVLSAALQQAAYAQIPVVPTPGRAGRWVEWHYADEFARAHRCDMVVRDAIRAPLPTAGVGCAFRVDVLRALDKGPGPFEPACLTEDYEIGLRLSAMGHRGRFVRVRASDGRLIASRGCFPGQFLASARQKARWIRGIALEGWDRLGWPRDGQCRWPGDLAAWWMVWRDRRAPLAAAVSVLAYAALLLLATHRLIGSPIALPRGMAWLLTATAALAVWRVLVRAWATASLYGWRQALPSIPRVLVANIILCAAAAMAVYDYMAGRFGRALVWNKTEHRFPT